MTHSTRLSRSSRLSQSNVNRTPFHKSQLFVFPCEYNFHCSIGYSPRPIISTKFQTMTIIHRYVQFMITSAPLQLENLITRLIDTQLLIISILMRLDVAASHTWRVHAKGREERARER